MSKRNRILYFSLLVLFIVFSRICFLSHNIDQYDTAMFVGSVKTKVLLHAPGYVPFIIFGSLLNRLTVHLPLSFSLANTILFIIAALTWTYYVNKDNIDKYSIFISLIYIFTPSIWLYSIIGMSDGSQFALSSVILTIMFFNNPKEAKNITHLNLIYFIYGILLGIKTIHIILLPIITLYTYQYLYYKKIIIKSLSLPILFFILSILTWVLPQRFYYDDSLIKNSSISLIKRDLGNYAIFGNYYKNISDIFIKIKDLMSFSPYIGLNKNILITITSYFIIGFSILLKIVSRLSKETTRTNEFLKKNVSKYRRVIYPIYYILAYGLFYLLLFAPRTRYFLSTIPAFYLLIHAFIKIKTNKKYLNYVETISMATLVFSFLRVGYINIYPYHKYIDGRTQAINTIKDKTSIDKNQLIVINQYTYP